MCAPRKNNFFSSVDMCGDSNKLKPYWKDHTSSPPSFTTCKNSSRPQAKGTMMVVGAKGKESIATTKEHLPKTQRHAKFQTWKRCKQTMFHSQIVSHSHS
jgi:hypothetical protein